ncbi:MAG TPA: biotin/lipoyl-binding protein [Candidatus Cybelea sp.]|nr:biotin/lipoyl-binding protein [Candidatus Cybelea sp.]
MSASMRHRLAVAGVFVVLAAGIGAVVLHERRPAPDPRLVGMVRETEIAIAPGTSGRLKDFKVKPGEMVHKGQLLAVIDNPELSAGVDQAKAAAAVARASRDHVYAGTRDEEIASLARGVQIAEANLTFARQQNARSAALAPANFVSKQRMDEDTAAVSQAQAELSLRQAELARGRAGPTAEERAKADAQVDAADAAVAVLEARLAKTSLTAPEDGIVAVLVSVPGEAVLEGEPVLTIYAAKGAWFGFIAREDRIVGLKMGTALKLNSLDGTTIPATVTEIRPLGEFATWRAARAVGDHDLNTFLVRADPTAESGDLAPGMSVLADVPR